MNKQSAEKFLEYLINLPEVLHRPGPYVNPQPLRSPDGQHIALTISNLHANWDVFLTNPNEYHSLIPLTNTNEMTRLVEWWPDSQSVLVAEDTAGNERLMLYRVSITKSYEWQRLTPENLNYYMRGPTISPDGKNLYYFLNYDPSMRRETENFHLFRQNVDTFEVHHLTSAQKPAYNFPMVNRAGTVILYPRSDIAPGGTQYWLINTDGSDDREILNFGANANIQASWHPDSNQIVFNTDSYRGTRLKKWLTGIYSIKTEEIEWFNRSGKLSQYDFSFAHISRFAPSILVLFAIYKARLHSFFYDLEKKQLTTVPNLLGTLVPLDPLENGKWMGIYYHSTQPTTLVSFYTNDLDNLTLKEVTWHFDNFANSKLKQDQLTPAQELEWMSEDNRSIHGWFYQSQQNTDRGIIYVHGGPTAHSEDRLNIEIQYYVSQGFHVLDPNYRGSTGYSIQFREAIKEDHWGGREQSDIAMGAEALYKRGFVTSGRIGITGTSFGGFSAWHAITRYPQLFKASAPVCGMTDLRLDYETTRPDLRTYTVEMMGGSPEEVPEYYTRGSPITYVSNIKGKVLIVHGLQDPNVPPDQVELIEKPLKMNKIDYKKLIFEDEGHEITKKANQQIKIAQIWKFFDLHL